MFVKFSKKSQVGTKAKPLSKITHHRHVVIFSKTPNFRGGLTLVPNCCKQPQKHQDVPAKHMSSFFAMRKS